MEPSKNMTPEQEEQERQLSARFATEPMDDELQTMWKQLAGWAKCLDGMAMRHVRGEPCEDPHDPNPPRFHIERLLREMGQIYGGILAKECAQDAEEQGF
jgi:hypothetical protein